MCAFATVNDDIEIMRPPEGTAYSFTAGADILAGQVVSLSGANAVSPSSTDGEQCIGVAAQSVSSGDEVMVLGPGARVRFTGGAAGISVNDALTSHGNSGEEGEVNTADETGDWIIGVAHETAGDGDTFIGTVAFGGQVN